MVTNQLHVLKFEIIFGCSRVACAAVVTPSPNQESLVSHKSSSLIIATRGSAQPGTARPKGGPNNQFLFQSPFKTSIHFGLRGTPCPLST